jgi:glycerol kinase
MQFIGAIDQVNPNDCPVYLIQGTSSTRFIVFNEDGKPVALHQEEFTQIQQHPGYIILHSMLITSWLEHDPKEIMKSVTNCVREATKNFVAAGNEISNIAGIGITNQRETTVVWDSKTGEPITNALVWCDTRTSSIVDHYKSLGCEDDIREVSGLPLSTYFSAVKLRWLIDNVPSVEKALKEDRLAFGTIDSWIIFNLTGGKKEGIHVTDVTNASRTLLLDIQTLKYSDKLIDFFGLKGVKLPELRSSAEVYGTVQQGELEGVKIAGCLGDQSAALVGHRLFEKGSAKNTYGTGYRSQF